MAYDFHYTPTGTGVISGKEVLEQTEDAINDLGNTAISGVQEALDKAEQALTNSENAVDDAQTALNTANNAEGVAIQAQTDVGNLSGTVTNIGNRVTTAEGNITNLQGRMTTAEGNITNLQGRMTTAETNIGNLQTAVSTAQATANSAQQTATTARQQSYVFRYSSTALTPSSTNANSLLDNTDNLKVGDKVIDSSGVLFSVTAIDTQNSTFTIGTALVDLAQDSDVVHKSGDETVGGEKTFTNGIILQNSNTSGVARDYLSKSQIAVLGDSVIGDSTKYRFVDKNNNEICYIRQRKLTNSNTDMSFCVNNIDNNNNSISAELNFIIDRNNDPRISPSITDYISLGRPTFRWKSIYSNSYYYGNIEFSTKFVTTDTAQTITGAKVFSATPYIYNSDVNGTSPNLYLRNQLSEKGNAANSNSQQIVFVDKNAKRLSQIQVNKGVSGETSLNFRIETIDNANNDINSQINYYITKSGTKNFTANANNEVNLGISGNKWKDVNTYLVNGLTPSSLSMPSNTGYVDISGYFTNTGDGQTNTYTASVNGWIYLNVVATRLIMQIRDSNDNNIYADMRVRSSDETIYMTIPIGSGNKLLTQWFTSSSVTVTTARFIPCQGNI